MELQDVLYEVQHGVGIITMNRPERLNASSPAMTRSMIDILENLTEDVRALVLTGAGRAFCAGGDVRNMSDRLGDASLTPAWQRNHPEKAVSVAFWNCERPIIAAVNGHAVGLGMAYASMCDFRIASDRAQFGALWVKRGFMPDAGGTFFLPFLLGVPRALELIWTGDLIDAQEAQEIGLVRRVVPHEDLHPHHPGDGKTSGARPHPGHGHGQAGRLQGPYWRFTRGAGVRELWPGHVAPDSGPRGGRKGLHGEARGQVPWPLRPRCRDSGQDKRR